MALKIDHAADLENDEARPRILQSAAERAWTVSGERGNPEQRAFQPSNRRNSEFDWYYQCRCSRRRLFASSVSILRRARERNASEKEDDESLGEKWRIHQF